MVKKNDIWGYLVVGALILAAVYVGQGKFNFGGTGGVTTVAPLTCTQSGTATLTPQAVYYDASKPVGSQVTVASTDMIVYPPGNPVPLLTGVTGNSVTVNCGSTSNVTFGDNSAYYILSRQFVATNATNSPTVVLKAIETPTITYNNGTVAGFSASDVKVFGVANSYPNTDVSLRMKIGNGYFGDPDAILVMAYDPARISGVSGIAGTAVSVPVGILNVPAGDAVQAWAISGLTPNQQITMSPTITTATLDANALNNTAIKVWVVSQATYNNNGAPQTASIIDPTTRTALVPAIIGGNILIYG